jgi:hypothetical protein
MGSLGEPGDEELAEELLEGRPSVKGLCCSSARGILSQAASSLAPERLELFGILTSSSNYQNPFPISTWLLGQVVNP